MQCRWCRRRPGSTPSDSKATCRPSAEIDGEVAVAVGLAAAGRCRHPPGRPGAGRGRRRRRPAVGVAGDQVRRVREEGDVAAVARRSTAGRCVRCPGLRRWLTDTRVVVPATRSRTKTSGAPLVSPATRFWAPETKATYRPSRDISDCELGAKPGSRSTSPRPWWSSSRRSRTPSRRRRPLIPPSAQRPPTLPARTASSSSSRAPCRSCAASTGRNHLNPRRAPMAPARQGPAAALTVLCERPGCNRAQPSRPALPGAPPCMSGAPGRVMQMT